MKIYKITLNEYEYDTYDSFIVRAGSEERAIEFIKKVYPIDRIFQEIMWQGGYKIEVIEENGEEEIILDSFNAG